MMVAAAGFIIGTVLGSFIAATSARLIKEQSIIGRSYCLKCKKTLQWYDLFPIISFLLLRGKCRYCRKKIPGVILLSEVLMGFLVAFLFYLGLPVNILSLPFDLYGLLVVLELIFKLFIVTVLIIIAVVDFKTGYIYDKVTIPSSIAAFIFVLVITILKTVIFYQSFLKSPLAPYLAQTEYLFNHLRLIWEPFVWSISSGLLTAVVFILLIIFTRGKGMGWGDVKFVLFLGLALGFPDILAALFLAFLIGAIFSIILIIIKQKNLGQTVPFGPFLSLGSFIALIWGTQLVNWYLNSFR